MNKRPTVYDALRTERRRLFVGRRAELDQVAVWLSESPRPTRVVTVSGPPGIGKTAFLQAVQDLADLYGARRLWVDGRLILARPLVLVEHLETARRRGWQVSHWETLDGRPSVVLVDNYEALLALDDWFRHWLVDWIPAEGMLWVLAARGDDWPAAWARDLAWHGRSWSFALGPLNAAEVAAFFAERSLPIPPEPVLKRLGGVPLALQIAADHATASASALSGQIAREVTEAVWKAADEPVVRQTLVLLSTVHRADDELVERVVGRPPLEFFEALARIAVVRADPAGLSIHDAYRAWVRGDARRRWPDEFARVQASAARVLADRLRRHRDAQTELAGHLITIIREMLPQDPRYADMTAEFDAPSTPARPEDRAYLHTFLEHWQHQPLPSRDGPALHRLLDAWTDAFPHLVRVYRYADGRPVAFFAPLLLMEATFGLVERYVGSPAEWLGEPAESLAVPFAQADTYFSGLLGVAPDVPRTELVGHIMRDGLTLLATGMRSLLLVGNPFLVQMLLSLGYRPRQPARPTPDAWMFYELDRRGRDFAAWLLETTGGLLASRSSSFDIRELRYALDHLHDTECLGQSTLARVLGWDGNRIQHELLHLLESPSPPFPLTAEEQDLLVRLYRFSLPPDRLAAEYHVSRATFYRRLSRALGALKAALVRTETD
jgi:hypothetical protein